MRSAQYPRQSNKERRRLMCYSASMSFTLVAAGALCTAAALIDPELRRRLVFVPFAGQGGVGGVGGGRGRRFGVGV